MKNNFETQGTSRATEQHIQPGLSRTNIGGTIIRGHQVASGLASDCPWPGGSIARQLPLMAKLGVPVGSFFAGTLNVALDSESVMYPEDAEFDFVLDWRHPDKPTHFWLHALRLGFNEREYLGWSYRKMYPLGYVSLHPQPPNVIEVLAPFIPGISYGSRVQLRFLAAGV